MANRFVMIGLQAVERGSFPRSRRWLWRQVSNLAARVVEPSSAAADARAGDRRTQPSIGLHHHALAGLPLEGGRVVELSCGLGGGAAYAARRFAPGVLVGVETSGATVARARAVHAEIPGLRFEVGRIDALSAPDGSVDVVVAIGVAERARQLEGMPQEVARVLKPGGWFSWADLRSAAMRPDLDQAFAASGLALVSEMLLTDGVVRALERAHAPKPAALTPLNWLCGAAAADEQGAPLRQALKTGEALYLARRYRKLEPAG